MSRAFFATAAVGLLGFGAFRYFQPAAEASAPPVTASPEQQFKQLAALSVVPAGQLGRLCDTYPQVAAKVLKNRVLRVSGSVEDLFVTGLDGRRAIVTLHRGQRRALIAVYDMNHYAVLGLEPLGDRRIRYVLVGNELLKVTPAGIYRQGQRRIDVPEEIRKIIFTRTRPFEETVTFDRIAPDAIILKAAAR